MGSNNPKSIYPSLPPTPMGGLLSHAETPEDNENQPRNTPPTYDENSVIIFSIAPSQTDRLRLVDHPPEIVPLIRTIILNQWGVIQNELCSKNGVVHEFKLQGKPWDDVRLINQSVRTARLTIEIFKKLAASGWNFIQGANITRKEDAKDVLFFENSTPDPNVKIFSMTFHKCELIRLTDASPAVINILFGSIKKTWSPGVIYGQENQSLGNFEFKLKGRPWSGTVYTHLPKRLLFDCILKELRQNGFKLYASVSLTKKRDELDSWFFRKVTAAYK